MAKYTIIADVGKGLINMLRDRLVPEPIDKTEYIGICEPKERGGYIVGIHPYDIKEDASGQFQERIVLPDGSIQNPPAKIELYYMISVSSKADLDTRSTDEARIIGKIIQVFKDAPTIPSRYMPETIDKPLENIPISPLPLNMEEKVKVWTMFGESYKMSVFYVVGPIAIDSEVIHKPRRRVESIFLNSSQRLPRKVIQFETKLTDDDIDDEYSNNNDEEEEEEEEDMEEEEESGDDDSEDDISDDSDESDNDEESSDSEAGGDDSGGNDSESDDLGGDDLGGDDLGGDDLGGDDLDDDLGDS